VRVSWIASRSKLPGRPERPARRPPLALERLEDRCRPAMTVNGTVAGVGYFEGGLFEPPDTDAAAGPAHLVETVNAAVAVFDKATGQRLSLTPLSQFFKPINPGKFLSDPSVRDDDIAPRFIVATLDIINTTNKTFLDFAVSDSHGLVLRPTRPETRRLRRPEFIRPRQHRAAGHHRRGRADLRRGSDQRNRRHFRQAGRYEGVTVATDAGAVLQNSGRQRQLAATRAGRHLRRAGPAVRPVGPGAEYDGAGRPTLKTARGGLEHVRPAPATRCSAAST
jgi:hypothetical protein